MKPGDEILKADKFERTRVRLDLAGGRVLPASASGTPAVLYFRRNNAESVENAFAIFVDGPRVEARVVTRGPGGDLTVLGVAVATPFGVP